MADASEENTLGPTIETDERLVPRWTAKEARQIFLLEFQEGWAKAIACSHRVKTSEYRESGSRRIWSQAAVGATVCP